MRPLSGVTLGTFAAISVVVVFIVKQCLTTSSKSSTKPTKQKPSPKPNNRFSHKPPNHNKKKKFKQHTHHPESIESYPQPKDRKKFTYVPFDRASSKIFGLQTLATRLPFNMLVYTVQGKGTKSPGMKGKLFEKARVVEDDEADGWGCDGLCEDLEGDRRVKVVYSSGSTYKVRRAMCLPVIEFEKHCASGHGSIVLCCDETPIYRRLSAIHASASDDKFVEIGADFGRCTELVRRCKNAPDVEFGGGTATTSSTSLNGNGGFDNSVKGVDVVSKVGRFDVNVIGVDKSEESVLKATLDNPRAKFTLRDCFLDYAGIVDDCKHQFNNETGFAEVVSIDINGDRNLPEVLKAIKAVMNEGGDRTYLIIVKSRELYQSVKLQWQ